MIYAVATRKDTFGIGDYLKTDGADVGGLVKTLSTEELFDSGVLPIGAYIFAGLDQLTTTELALVVKARNLLASVSPSCARWNDPIRWKPRLALLQLASEAGINTFRATRATDRDRHRRFPVFIRSEPEHTGNLTPLLYDHAAVTRSLLRLMLIGYRLRDLIIVEYSDTSVDGVFTKYSSMALGPQIIPRALAVSRHWMTKFGADHDRAAADRDLQYVEENPHEAWVRQMFDVGGVDYGRIDYCLVNGAPQVWEINTNPTIGANLAFDEPSTAIAPLALGLGDDARYLRERGNRLFYQKLSRAIRALSEETRAALDADGVRTPSIQLPITVAERRALQAERREHARVRARKTAIARLVAPIRAAYHVIRSHTPFS